MTLTAGAGDNRVTAPGATTLDWVLVPHVDPELQDEFVRFKGEIAKALDLTDLKDLTTQKLVDARTARHQAAQESLRGCYTGCFGTSHNRGSMSVYSGPGPKSKPEKQSWQPRLFGIPFHYPFYWRGAVGWIGTGNAELKNDQVRGAWQRSYGKFLPNLST